QNVEFEHGLITRVLDDVHDEPGNLPLLEFALTLLWKQQEHGQLAHAAYDAVGGIEGALTRYADESFSELGQVERARARMVFAQMVRPGEGMEDTRRVATRGELGDDGWSLVQRLADARLVVTDRDPIGQETAEVVHEALIQRWEQLRSWIDDL